LHRLDEPPEPFLQRSGIAERATRDRTDLVTAPRLRHQPGSRHPHKCAFLQPSVTPLPVTTRLSAPKVTPLGVQRAMSVVARIDTAAKKDTATRIMSLYSHFYRGNEPDPSWFD
jgi:hypothetical protein